MKKTMLLTLLTLSITGINASDTHNREFTGPQSVSERASWKEAKIEQAELACDCCGGGSRDKDKGPRAYHSSYSTTNTPVHPGSIYYAINFSPSGHEMTLIDGSVWQVRSRDRYQTYSWLKTDEISVLPNTNFFSFYDYKLFNRMTGGEVEVNLVQQPIIGAVYTRQITGTNDNYNYVYLTDGTVWAISPHDEDVFKKWILGDIILIGVNTGTDAYIRPNILINATHQTYISANCVQQ